MTLKEQVVEQILRTHQKFNEEYDQEIYKWILKEEDERLKKQRKEHPKEAGLKEKEDSR